MGSSEVSGHAVIERYSRHPHRLTILLDHREPIADLPMHLPVHEDVLQLPSSRCVQGSQPISGLPLSNEDPITEGIGVTPSHEGAGDRQQTLRLPFPAVEPLSSN